MKNLLLVFIGGGLGSSLRYIVGKWLNPNALIPYGTFVANVLGSLLIGVILGWAIKNNALNNPVNLLIGVGFCGGFTTFSTFSFENYALLKSGDYLPFFVYFFSSLFFGMLAVFGGMLLSKQF
ncbi:MAG: fluoride efflux transporter CrcB [Bacteroidota bacterium]|uniref:fluoride efflux transporter CrcB n=1 Tax=Christiangramia flava TaxID=1486245 RepID=UPI0009FB817D|nr:fluoride efflux transporter CrcB [Christiangramia flava]MAM18632.1 fluoride efflux transporter CrcB [Christiangramia sp.]MEE2771127.1 fluoride efflux transporter CrcB [Bacteroidota bacterium]